MRGPKRKWTKEEDDFIVKNYIDMSYVDIAEKLKRHRQSIQWRIGKLKLPLKKISLKISPGDRFGKLIVIEKTEKRTKHGIVIYLCKCDCGGMKETNSCLLAIGDVKSCGCIKGQRVRETMSKPPGFTTYRQLFYQCRKQAISRNLEFLLTEEEHKEIISRDCYYCGINPSPFNCYLKKDGNRRSKHLKTGITEIAIERAWVNINTVDRLDSSKGYTVGNCVSACWPCNEMKMDTKENDFLDRIERIHNFQKQKNSK